MRSAWTAVGASLLAAMLGGARGPAPTATVAVEVWPPVGHEDLPVEGLRIAAFDKGQIAPTQLPRVGERPASQRALPAQGWPVRASMEVPADGRTQLVAWLDLELDGALDAGDWVSRPSSPLLLPPGERPSEPVPVELRVERIWVAAAAPASDVPPADIPVTVILGGGLRGVRGDVLVMGFLPKDLVGEMPGRQARPRFVDRLAHRAALPEARVLRRPPGMLGMPVLDVNRNGNLDPGDYYGLPRTLDSAGVELTVDRVLPHERRGCG